GGGGAASSCLASGTELPEASSVTWKQRRLGSALLERRCVSSQSMKPVSRALSRERRTNRHSGFFCAAKDSEAPTTQRSIFFRRSLRPAAATNSPGSTSL